jgi:hypothetical protein
MKPNTEIFDATWECTPSGGSCTASALPPPIATEHTRSKPKEVYVSVLLTYVLYTFYDTGSHLTINVKII